MSRLALVALLSTLTLAQEHTYKPGEARLVHATSKWLLWKPDDKGASLEGGGGPRFPRSKAAEVMEKFRDVYVLQRTGRPKDVRVVPVQQLSMSGDPKDAAIITMKPVTVRDDGVLVFLDSLQHKLAFVRASGLRHFETCVVNKTRAGVVALYPDGMVAYHPHRWKKGGKTTTLYWVPWGARGADMKKARKMCSYPRSRETFSIDVVRHGDKIATPQGVYSLTPGGWKPYATPPGPETVQAFDGRYVVGARRVVAVRKEDEGDLVPDRSYIVARHGVVYWLAGARSAMKKIMAAPLRTKGRTRAVGRIRYSGRLFFLPILANTLSVHDLESKKRFTIYWDDKGLHWSSGNRWRFKAWLKPTDFE